MTPLKLLTILLGLAAIVGGAFLVTHNPVAGGTLLAAGGKLLGLALPEIGKKLAPAEKVDDTTNFGPPLLVLFLAFAVHQQGCATVKPPCNEDKMRAIDAAYLKDLAKSCLAYPSAAECPDYPILKAKHERELEACPQ